MSSPRGPKGSNAQFQKLSREAVAKIAEVLQDPRVRDMLMENGGTLLDMARQWRDEQRERRAQRDGPGPIERLSVRASKRFGVGRLRLRVDRLGDALDTLVAHGPELTEALGGMRSQVREVRQRIPVVEALNGRPRRRMLRAFDRRLDAIEGALADAMLASPGDSE